MNGRCSLSRSGVARYAGDGGARLAEGQAETTEDGQVWPRLVRHVIPNKVSASLCESSRVQATTQEGSVRATRNPTPLYRKVVMFLLRLEERRLLGP